MRFTPKTEEEIAAENLLQPGEYGFTVMEAEDTQSKAGNDMMKVKLEVFAPDGGTRHVYDYLLEKMAFKLRHFAATVGRMADYERGELSADAVVGRSGLVRIEIEPAGDYPAKNVVKDYVVAPKPPANQPAAQQAETDGDGLPF